MVYDWCSLCGIEIGIPETYVPTYEGKIVPTSQEHAMSPICKLCSGKQDIKGSE